MKLFYKPGACSLSPHIVLCELALPHTLVKVDLKTHTTESGEDYYTINSKGYVPALQLESGEVLTEGPAIVQYLADQKPEGGLLPVTGSLARAQVQEWLNYIGTELHKNMSPLFRPGLDDQAKAAVVSTVEKRLAYVEQALQGKDYLTGSHFSVADAYLFTVVGWTDHLPVSLEAFPTLQAYQQRVSARPAVQQALKDEGLI